MYYIIYKTTNKINDMYYIGMHKTRNLDDGYLGSGKHFKRALEKYGEENFEREILEYCDSDEEMHRAEARYVTEDVVNDKNSYNLKLGGEGGWDYVNNNKLSNNGWWLENDNWIEEQRKFGKIGAERFLNKLKTDKEFSENWHKNHEIAIKSPERCSKISEGLKKYFKQHGHHNKGKSRKLSKEQAEKLRRSVVEYMRSDKNPNLGTCWISNTLIKKSIKIKKEFLYDYIAEGWIKKRIIKW